jgi:mono/diheme cytochrome c family protein
MRPVNFLVALIIVAFLVAILVLLSGGTQINSAAGLMDDPQETVTIEAGERISITSKPVESLVSSREDGRSLLESHCAKCHLTQGLKQLKKSRSEWEVTLAQMEALGAHLNDAEKAILIDYLASAENP